MKSMNCDIIRRAAWTIYYTVYACPTVLPSWCLCFLAQGLVFVKFCNDRINAIEVISTKEAFVSVLVKFVRSLLLFLSTGTSHDGPKLHARVCSHSEFCVG